tara:strand:+ start:72 stop:260 length:189 start_codon:yes stop_codon:yes gene_type:complete
MLQGSNIKIRIKRQVDTGMTKKQHSCKECDFKNGLCSVCNSSNLECSIDENTGMLVCDECFK